jgi:hypothetical protein
MGADDDADTAVGDALLHLALLGGFRQPRKLRDLNAESSKTLAEGLHMLANQHRGRRDHSDLPAAHGSGGPERDLRLAEADIAADQPALRPLPLRWLFPRAIVAAPRH